MTHIGTIALVCFCMAAGALAAQSTDSGEVQLVGRVVDAACYLIHPDEASGSTHDECGAACAKQGVPLGIMNEADNKLYLDLEGATRLLPHLHQRVRVTGVTEKKEGPLRLEMAVSETNTMEVALQGEYYVVNIRDVARAPASAGN